MPRRTRASTKRAKERIPETCDEDPETKELFDLVFLNELLREKILDFVIHDAAGTAVSSEDALSCRLVQKAWLETVSRCLVKSGESFLQFTVLTRNDNNRSSEFLDVLEESHRVLKRVPPFKLSVDFRPSNFEQSRQLFEKYLRSACSSKGIVELRVSFFDGPCSSKAGRSSVFLDTRQPISLPILRKLSLLVPTFGYEDDGAGSCYRRLREDDMDEDEGDVDVDIKFRNIAPTASCILSGCTQLTDFHLDGLSSCTLPSPQPIPGRGARFVLEESFPPGFEDISLPATIKKLKIEQGMSAGDMEKLVLKNNRISNLTQLTLTIPSGFHTPKNGNDLIYRVLDRHCNSLRKLEIRGDIRRRREGLQMTQIRLPVMTRLESLIIRARNCEWPYGTANLEEKLPAMKKMELNFVTMEASLFESVEEAVIYMGPTFLYLSPDVLTLDLACSMHQAFPNLTKLTISTILLTTVTEALQELFRNMTQLQVLALEFRQNHDNRSPSIRVLYSLLRGHQLNKRTENVSLPSIANLTELEEFKLTLNGFHDNTYLNVDLLFRKVLFGMPKLRKVTLPWQFQVSPAIVRRWERREDGEILMETREPYGVNQGFPRYDLMLTNVVVRICEWGRDLMFD